MITINQERTVNYYKWAKETSVVYPHFLRQFQPVAAVLVIKSREDVDTTVYFLSP